MPKKKASVKASASAKKQTRGRCAASDEIHSVEAGPRRREEAGGRSEEDEQARVSEGSCETPSDTGDKLSFNHAMIYLKDVGGGIAVLSQLARLQG